VTKLPTDLASSEALATAVDWLASAADESDRHVDGQRVATSRNTRPTIATEFTYQWLLDPSSRFVAVAGLGLKRFLGARSDQRNPINDGVLPTAA